MILFYDAEHLNRLLILLEALSVLDRRTVIIRNELDEVAIYALLHVLTLYLPVLDAKLVKYEDLTAYFTDSETRIMPKRISQRMYRIYARGRLESLLTGVIVVKS